MTKSVSITSTKLKKYIGKTIFVEKSDGTRVEGKLVAVKNGQAYLKPIKVTDSNKPVTTSFFFFGFWIIGLLAIVGIGLLLWCSCCGARVHRGGCGCGCRRRPYRAKRPYRHHHRASYRRRRYI